MPMVVIIYNDVAFTGRLLCIIPIISLMLVLKLKSGKMGPIFFLILCCNN